MRRPTTEDANTAMDAVQFYRQLAEEVGQSNRFVENAMRAERIVDRWLDQFDEEGG